MGVSPAKRKQRKKGGGGFFSHVPGTKFASQTAKDLGQIAENAPGGVVAFGKAGYAAGRHPGEVYHDIKALRPYLWRNPHKKPNFESPLAKFLYGSAASTSETVLHPARHPGYTLVLGLAAGNPALKGVSRVRGVAKAGEANAANYAAAARGIHMLHVGSKMSEKDAIARVAPGFGMSVEKLTRAYDAIKPAVAARHEAEIHAKGGVGTLDPADAAIYDEAIMSASRSHALGFERTLKYRVKSEAERKKWERSGVVPKLPTKGPEILKLANELGVPTVKSQGKGGLQLLRPHRDILFDIKKKMGPPEIVTQVPRSQVPTTQAFQSALDALTSKVQPMQRHRVKKAVARELDLAKRPEQELAPGFKESAKAIFPTKKSLYDPKYQGKLVLTSFRHADKEINSLIRGLRLYRPGYIPPNALGALAANVTHMGKSFPSNVAAERFVRSNFPEAAATIDKRMGETAAQAAAEVGKFEPDKHLPASTLMRGVGTSLGKLVDRRARARSFIEEAKRRHPDWTTEDVVKYLDHPAMLHEMNRINDVAEREALNFSKTKPLPGFSESVVSKVDRALSRNVFLWRWAVASSRYYGRILKEHPTLTAGLAVAGQQAEPLTDVLPDYPTFMASYIPWGAEKVTGKKMPRILNPQAASLYNMAPEIAGTLRTASKGGERAVDVLHERLNPVQHGAGVFLRGRDPFRQQTITAGKKGARYPSPFSQKAALAALRAELSGNPYSALGRMFEPESVRQKRLFPRDPETILKQFLLGQGFVPSPVNPKIAKSMATKQKHPHGGGRKRRRKTGY